MKWSDVPATWQNTVIVCAAIAAVMGFGFRTFQTIEAAEYQQQSQAQEFRSWRESDIDAQIAQYRYQLLSTQLTAAQREWILAEIRRLEEQLKCIRAGQC